MIGSNANQQESQNNQMLQECIWNSITPLVQQRLAQYKTEYTLGHHLCGPLLPKVIIRMFTMDSRETVSILQAKLKDIASYAIGVSGDVEKITAYFTKNVSLIKAAGASVSDPVDILFKGLLAVPCKEFCRYIGNKEDLHHDESLMFTASKLSIMAQRKYMLMKARGTFAKSLTLEGEIIAMRAELTQFKNRLTLMENTMPTTDPFEPTTTLTINPTNSLIIEPTTAPIDPTTALTIETMAALITKPTMAPIEPKMALLIKSKTAIIIKSTTAPIKPTTALILEPTTLDSIDNAAPATNDTKEIVAMSSSDNTIITAHVYNAIDLSDPTLRAPLLNMGLPVVQQITRVLFFHGFS